MAERLFFIYDDSKYFTKNIKLGVTEHKANRKYQYCILIIALVRNVRVYKL